MAAHSAHLDHRYSDDTADVVPWAETVARIAGAEVAWIVTVRPDGSPHATPLVPVIHGEKVYFRTGVMEVKYANISANPHVLVLAGDTAWERGLDVSFAGTARPVTDTALRQRLADLWRERWDGRWNFAAEDDTPVLSPAGIEIVIFEVAPSSVFSFAKGGPFGQTTHRFPATPTQSTTKGPG